MTSLFRTGGDKINVTGTVGDVTAGIESVAMTNTTNSDSVTAELRGDFYAGRGLTLNSGSNSLKAEATDRAGNKKTVQNHTVNLHKDLTQGIEYTYDANGSLEKREDKDNQETINYYYNLQNRLEFGIRPAKPSFV